MFDLPLPIHPTTYARVVPTHFATGDVDPDHPFALTLSRRAPADLLSGRAAPLVLARFATLAEAMQGAIDHAEGKAPDAAPQLLAILDRDEQLVLAGAASDHAQRLRHRADLLDGRLVDPLWRAFAARALQVAA